MLNIKPENFIHCPFCAKKLSTIKIEEKDVKNCVGCKWYYFPHVKCAVGALIIQDNKILFAKRNREPFKDTYMLPAGYVDYGEHPEDTLKREVIEETGLEVVDFKLLDIIQNPDDPRAVGHFGIFYLVTKIKGKVVNNDVEENSLVKWFNIKDLPKIGFKSHKEILKEYLK